MKKERRNLDIWAYAAKHDVRMGEIAEAMGKQRSNFSAAMRTEFDQNTKKEVRAAINKIVEARAGIPAAAAQ